VISLQPDNIISLRLFYSSCSPLLFGQDRKMDRREFIKGSPRVVDA
jgi:hypothetical protein